MRMPPRHPSMLAKYQPLSSAAAICRSRLSRDGSWTPRRPNPNLTSEGDWLISFKPDGYLFLSKNKKKCGQRADFFFLVGGNSIPARQFYHPDLFRSLEDALAFLISPSFAGGTERHMGLQNEEVTLGGGLRVEHWKIAGREGRKIIPRDRTYDQLFACWRIGVQG